MSYHEEYLSRRINKFEGQINYGFAVSLEGGREEGMGWEGRGVEGIIIIIIIILFIYFMLFLQMQGAHSLLQAHCYKLCTETLLQKH